MKDEVKARSPSMREFDYFADGARPVGWSGLDEVEAPNAGLEESLQVFRRQRRRNTRALLVMTVFFAVMAWFASGFRDWIAYVFSDPTEPIVIEDVTRTAPSAIPLNAYVQVKGITEHRGLSQKMVRGIGLVREEFWYFRLLGSRGVFVEVPPDPKRYGFTTQVTVSGRAVDPARDPSYSSLLADYRRRFAPRERRALRIIQADVRPGEGQTPFIVAGLILLVLLGLNLLTLWRFIRHVRAGPGAMIVRPPPT